MTIELTSSIMTDLKAKKSNLTAKASAVKSEFQRLSRNQNSDVSVHRWTEDHNGIDIDPIRTGTVSSTEDQSDELQQVAMLQRTLAGEEPEFVDIPSRKALLNKQWHAFESAIEHVDNAIFREHNRLAIQYCKNLKPKHNELMKRFCKALADVHPLHLELSEMRRSLIDSGIGLHNICLTMPDTFLGHPNDGYSELADFFKEARREGYINSIPPAFAA